MKATKEIKEVTRGIYSPYQYVDKEGTIYTVDMVEELSEDGGVILMGPTIDYWTRLEHTYAGMAMQGILACEEWKISPREGVSFAGEVALQAQEIAHALVEKMKEVK